MEDSEIVIHGRHGGSISVPATERNLRILESVDIDKSYMIQLYDENDEWVVAIKSTELTGYTIPSKNDETGEVTVEGRYFTYKSSAIDNEVQSYLQNLLEMQQKIKNQK